MKQQFYKINRYPNVFKHAVPRCRGGYSIDEVGPTGNYIAQVAFWFRTPDEATARLAEIIKEDKADGWDSAEWKGGER